jgi:hypothetical protein
MPLFPPDLDLSVSDKEVKYLHVLLSVCAELYKIDLKLFKNRIKELHHLTHISDISYSQYIELINTIKQAILARQPNYNFKNY